MNEHQVDVLESGLLQGRLYLRLGALVANQAPGHLGGEEDLVTGQAAALTDRLAASRLVAVCRGRVNLSSRVSRRNNQRLDKKATYVAVASLEGLPDALLSFISGARAKQSVTLRVLADARSNSSEH